MNQNEWNRFHDEQNRNILSQDKTHNVCKLFNQVPSI